MEKDIVFDYTKNGEKIYCTLHHIKSKDEIPQNNVTAVCAILHPINDLDKIICVVNPRGLDLPGGHVEEGESYIEALTREVKEEAHANIKKIHPSILLKSKLHAPKITYMIIYEGTAELESFHPTDEVTDRKIISENEFLKNYFGNNTFINEIFKMRKYIRGVK